MNIFKRAKTRYILHRYAIRHDLWIAVADGLRQLQGMSSVEKAHLRELSALFLHQKNIVGVGIPITEEMRISIAAQACLPVLAMGIELLTGWTDIIIYPGAFRVNRDEMDEYGIVHHNDGILSGEAWSRGPIILSWDDIEQDLQGSHHGHNVIIHEIAHKLDMLDGRANGMPPLHTTMQTPQWTVALSAAYEQLHQRLEHHHRVCVNPYAATSPAEFFAVFSEYFFCAPEILHSNFASVYEQLRLYYRQDPLIRCQLNPNY
jgi:Mlc titration factor MtfA (ptsG expression regulator)